MTAASMLLEVVMMGVVPRALAAKRALLQFAAVID
jgi:hypothetical protein